MKPSLRHARLCYNNRAQTETYFMLLKHITTLQNLKMKSHFLWWIKVGTLVIILVLILLNFVVFQVTNGANQRLHMSHSSCCTKEGAKLSHAQSVHGILAHEKDGEVP